ncbi:Beta-lactamase superfamily domain protein [Neomoorella glycerini]|uniref:Beta-lactamase superfamily domain protein n=1 Tax=Neomoorella glycerini TaxID=55779 RepID=A0A6I5ZST1_9FIRM|nr:MBL fold metallo-hydrolase [Moorella glycerini]QGP92786.1 Beta-lactamase superfamily domain protein [Moorella glycerini]
MRWLGHASFYLETPAGVRLVTDPYGPQVSPAAPVVTADVVTISHEHFDHNYLDNIKGNPEVWGGLTPDGDWAIVDHTFKDVRAYTVPTYHDDAAGAKRGKNAVFVLEVGDLRLAHLGDLGHALNDEQVQRIGWVDVLMIPVGGYFTIDAPQAWQVVAALKPRVVLPMHYLVPGMQGFPIAGVDEFTAGRANVRRLGEGKIDLRPEILPQETEVWVLAASQPRV